MDSDLPSPEAEDSETTEAPSPSTLANRVVALRDWTSGNPWRIALVSGALLLMIVATTGTWLYVASLAVGPPLPTLEETLAAYDRQEYDVARVRAVRLLESATLELPEYGTPLFVLGAVKAAQAETQWLPSHRQSEFLIASQYLREAQSVGFPEAREEEGLYLLGYSLIESGDSEAGIAVLEELLLTQPQRSTEVHLALAAAYITGGQSEPTEALMHVVQALARGQLDPVSRGEAILLRAHILTLLNRFDEALALLQGKDIPTELSAAVQIAAAHVPIERAKLTLQQGTADQEVLPQELRNHLQQIIDQLRQIPSTAPNVQQAMYLVGEGLILLGDRQGALKQFRELRRLYAATPDAIAASIAEGDLHLAQHDTEPALLAYRHALAALEQPYVYRNRLMPLTEIRQRILAAHSDFILQQQFSAAKQLVEQLQPLFDATRQLELRAETLRSWGTSLLSQASTTNVGKAKLENEGRLRLRQAGQEYEALSHRRFATPHYTDDVWFSADTFFLGHSYSNAIRMLNEYLRHEPVNRNAQALLRLGQSYLAMREVQDSISAFSECIDLHPQDAAVFRARLDCARAHRDQGATDKAEELLLANLNGSGQSPASPEWRDSLFELGHLLHDMGRYSEAIDRLHEAVHRYPDAEQTQLAMYIMGEAHRHAADAPLAALAEAQTVNEREKNTTKARFHLIEAQQYYDQVRSQLTRHSDGSLLMRTMLRNCYMMQGAVLFDLGRIERSSERFEEAIKAYSNVSTLYQNQPFVLQTFFQIAHCQRRLNRPEKARLNIAQALQSLKQLPEDADFKATTNFNRSEWKLLLTQMLEW